MTSGRSIWISARRWLRLQRSQNTGAYRPTIAPTMAPVASTIRF